MIARRFGLVVSVLVCALVGALVFAGASAQALILQKYEAQITAIPAEGPHKEAIPKPGPLHPVFGLATESGVLYAEDGLGGSAGRLDEFDAATGAFLSQPTLPGITFGEGAGERQEYNSTGRVVDVFGPGVCGSLECSVLQKEWTGADTPNESFTSEKGAGSGKIVSVAVDRSTSVTDWARGDVFVATSTGEAGHSNLNVVDVFKPEADGGEKYISTAQLTGPALGEPFQEPSMIAVSGFNGDVLVVDKVAGVNGRVIDVFKPVGVGEYTFVHQIVPPQALSIYHMAVDASTGEIYVAANGGNPEAFSVSGEYLAQVTGQEIPAGAFEIIDSLAVDPLSHRLFVADHGASGVARVYEFSGILVPDVSTGLVSNVHLDPSGNTWGLTLNGTVDPDGAGAATCRFEWGSTPSFGNTTACGEGVPNGSVAVPVQASVEGLQPGTTYYYRLQASNENGSNEGNEFQDQSFTTPGPSISEESASSVTATSATLNAAIDPDNNPTSYYFQYGTSASYGQGVPLPPGLMLGSGTSVLSTSVHIQDLIADTVYHYRVVAVSEVAGEAVTAAGPDETFTTQTVGGGLGLPDGRQWEMVSPPDKHGALISGIDISELVQASVNGNAIAYSTDAPTESESQGYTNGIQVFSGRGPNGWVSRDISPPNLVATGKSIGEGNPFRFFSEDLSLSVVQPFGAFDPAISSEASEQTAMLRTDYLNGNVDDLCAEACYRPLVTGKPGFANAPEGTVFGGDSCPPGLICGPTFAGATPDLSHVFLESRAGLTVPASSSPGPRGAPLYEWTGGRLKASSTSEMPSPRDLSSEDGSWVYSFSGKVLAPGGIAGACTCNLYVTHNGTTKLVAILSGADSLDWTAEKGSRGIARVSPNGRWIAFMSQRELTGYDNRDAVSGKPDEEVYLYDAEANGGGGRLVCASCNPTGARPVGTEMSGATTLINGYDVWPGGSWLAANIPPWIQYDLGTEPLYQPRYLSNSGRLFFNSSDALVPQDVNGAEDVYEYEPSGVGDCTRASMVFSVRSGGCVNLISSGSSPEESAFLDASGNGGDVFFLTAAKLSPADYDTSLDVYDAHECTSASPCYPKPAATPPACETEASCRAAPVPQPAIFGSPSSATFAGAGNVTPSRPVLEVKKSLTRAQKLTRALKACLRKRRGKQSVCKHQAIARYGRARSREATTKIGRG